MRDRAAGGHWPAVHLGVAASIVANSMNQLIAALVPKPLDLICQVAMAGASLLICGGLIAWAQAQARSAGAYRAVWADVYDRTVETAARRLLQELRPQPQAAKDPRESARVHFLAVAQEVGWGYDEPAAVDAVLRRAEAESCRDTSGSERLLLSVIRRALDAGRHERS